MSASSPRLELPAGSILVIAPHPDDETLGCGGLIAAAVERGLCVHTVFVTDGGASHPGSPTWSRARLAARRRAEGEEALRRLGAGAMPRTFLDLPDAAMPHPGSAAHEAAVAAIAQILRDLAPDLVALPWRRDPHGDHRAAWRMTMAAIGLWGGAPGVLEYAIWLDELGAPADFPAVGEMERVWLAVSGAAKAHALEAHESQLGRLIRDDPNGFALEPATIARLTGSEEAYWRACAT